MNSKPKKFLAKLLVLCMIVGMLPAIALSTGMISVADAAYYSTTSDTKVTEPSTSGGSTTVELDVKPTTSGNTSSATVNKSNMDKAVKSAVEAAEKNGTDPVVEVKIETPDKATGLKVTLPSSAVEALSADSDASLAITSGVAELTLDSTALGAVAEQAGTNVTVSVTPAANLSAAQKETVGEAPVYDLSMTSGSKAITSFDGGVLTVALPYTLAEGQSASNVVVYYLTDEANLEACSTSFADGKVTFTTTHLSKYVVGDKAMANAGNPFEDVSPDKWYFSAVKYCYQNNLVAGISDSKFAPDATTTRAMVVTVLYNLEGRPAAGSSTFADVASGAWYDGAIAWAAENDIVAGYNADTFGPNDTMTREQIATVLYNYAVYKDVVTDAGADLSAYTDADQIDSWAVTAMQWANSEGIINGVSATTLAPIASASRAELAGILMNYYENVVK